MNVWIIVLQYGIFITKCTSAVIQLYLGLVCFFFSRYVSDFLLMIFLYISLGFLGLTAYDNLYSVFVGIKDLYNK